MDYSNTVQVVEGRHELSYEGTGGGLRQSLLLEVATDMGEQFSPLCYLRDQAVQVVSLHGLIESDDIWVPEPSHELSLSE